MKTSKGFKFWTGDVNFLDYGGTWARKVGPRQWHFIVLTNMVDACGRDNEGYPTYSVELKEVNLNDIPAKTQTDAWKCADGDCQIDPDDTDMDKRDLVTAECCLSYGASAPLHEESTNNALKGIAECRKESYRLTRDSKAYADAMARPVNRLGSTAKEYMQGDMTSAIVRGAASGNQDAKLMAKLYVNCNGQTLGGKIPDNELDAMRDAIND